MGNKTTGPLKDPDAGTLEKEEGSPGDGGAGDGASKGSLGPSPELVASLQSLGEDCDYTLLPQSLHQIAEAYSLKEDYQWAIQFLQLEKLYHERLLSNLAALQENWEGQWRERRSAESETDNVIEKHLENLSQICKTHHRPTPRTETSMLNKLQGDILCSKGGQCDENDSPLSANNGDTKISQPEATLLGDLGSEETEPSSQQSQRHLVEEEEEEEDDGEEDIYEEGQEVDEEEEEEAHEETPEGTPEEEEVKVEWPAGVPQASAKDLVKLSHAEGTSSPDGLVSILKRRRASLDGLPPPGPVVTKHSAKRKVRFTEPEDGMEQDEVGGDSCLILLLLCLVTVVISIGGTALYCTLVDTYSNICTDFSQNVNFYIANVRRVFNELNHWLPLRT